MTTFTGGQSMPAYGSAAYTALQSGNPSAPTTPTGGGAVVNPVIPSNPVAPTVPKIPAPTPNPVSNQNTAPLPPQGAPGVGNYNPTPVIGTSTPTPTSLPASSATQNYINSTNANNARTAQVQQTFQQKLDQFTNGTVPLNSYQQAQIDSTKASFQSLIAAQQLANKNYEGGISVTNQTMGLSKYSPDMAAGRVLTAVNQGLSKIADLDTRMNSAVANMQQGFQDSNYSKVKDSYNDLIQSQKDKTTEIENIYTAAKQEESDLKTSQQEETMSTVDSALLDPTMSIEDKKKLVSDSVYQGHLTSTQIKDLQDSLQKQIDNEAAPNKPLPGLQGEYQFYAQQERDAGRVPLNFFDFKNYQTNATIGAGINPITGQPITKADQQTTDEINKQNALDLQTVNSAYTSIEGILNKYGSTPETFSKDIADKMNDIDVETVAKAVARIQNPDITRMGGDAGNALSPTSLGEKGAQLFRSLYGGKQYLPEKVVDAVSAAKSARDARQAKVDNPAASQMSQYESDAQNALTNYVKSNMGQKDMIATALETPDAAFGGKPPTHLQLLQALRQRGYKL